MSTGYITIKVYTADKAMPVPKAQIRIIDLRIALDQTIYADSYGNAERIKVYAPEKDTSLKPQDISLPYETYNIEVVKEGYIPTVINNVQVFSGETSLQPVAMIPQPEGQSYASLVNNFEISPNGLLLKTEKAQVAVPETTSPPQTKPVYIPDVIRVHLGDPDSGDKTVLVTFSDYIKNVASSEIYATWPQESLRANILAFISYALNRIYTGFYPSKGYNYDITSMPDRDPYYVDGRNIYGNINDLVDGIFNDYIKRIGLALPLLANYCNGISSRCEGLSEWGSVTLANQGQSAPDILKYYYGNIQTEKAKDIRGVEKIFPGSLLRLGDVGENVMTVQKQLNQIGKTYTNIPNIPKENGNFDGVTQDAVRAFQRQFNLSPDGIIGKKTWYQLAFAHNAAARLLALAQNSQSVSVPASAPAGTLREGASGADVRLLQYLLSAASIFYNSVLPVELNGTFGHTTTDSVNSFQKTFSIQQTGVVDTATWNALLSVYKGIEREAGAAMDNLAGHGAGRTAEQARPPHRIQAAQPVRPTQPRTAGPMPLGTAGQDRLAAAMSFANQDYVVPTGTRSPVNTDYSSGILDYVPETYTVQPDWMRPGTQAHQPDLAGGKGGLTGSPAKEPPAEMKPYPYTPWMKEEQAGTARPAASMQPGETPYPYTPWRTDEDETETAMSDAGISQIEMRTNPYAPRMTDDRTGISRPGTSISPGGQAAGRTPGLQPRTMGGQTGGQAGMQYGTMPPQPRTGTQPGGRTMQPGAMPARPGAQTMQPRTQQGTTAAGMVPQHGAGQPEAEPYECPSLPAVNPVYPSEALKIGSKGKNVQLMQEYLSYIALSLKRYNRITNELKVIVDDGNYGIDTTDAVIRFQNRYEMPVNGVIDAPTWAKIVEVYNNPCE